MADGDVKKGTVEWFDGEIGIILSDDGSHHLYVYKSSIKSDGEPSLGRGEAVEYLVEYDIEGRDRASNVTGPDGANVKGYPCCHCGKSDHKTNLYCTALLFDEDDGDGIIGKLSLGQGEAVKKGTVVSFYEVDGYILPDDGSDEVYVHKSSIKSDGELSLYEGQAVEYSVEYDSKEGRARASNVTGPDGANVKGYPRRGPNCCHCGKSGHAAEDCPALSFPVDDGDAHMKEGSVLWFNEDNGDGFIAPHDGSAHVRIRQSSIKSDGKLSLGQGEAVEYSVEYDLDGQAITTKVTGPNGANVKGYSGSQRFFSAYLAGFESFDAGPSGGIGPDTPCFNCGESGHMAKDCTEEW